MKKNFFSTFFCLIFAIFLPAMMSCNKPKDMTGEVVNGPMASFNYQSTYLNNNNTLHLTFQNHSSFSNRWLWEFEGMGKVVTKNIDTLIVRDYSTTHTSRYITVKLTAFSDVNVGVDGNGQIIYKTYEDQFTRQISIQKPY